MKKLFTIILIIACSHVFAQDSLKTFNNNRDRITGTGMEILGGWGTANVGVGAIGWVNSSGEAKYFHQMNVIWGAANFSVAILGYHATVRDRMKKLTAAQSLKEQERVEKIFLINGGFDIVYLGAGAYLKFAGHSRDNAQMQGYGESLLLQGSFLLVFDGLMYHAEKGNGSKLRTFLEKHPITFDGKRIGMIFNM